MIPELRNWKEILQTELDKYGNKKEDLTKIITLCDDYANEIRTVMDWISDKQAFVEQIRRQYKEIYGTRFSGMPPVEEKQTPAPKEITLTNSKDRKKNVREIALAISQPDVEITDKQINNEMMKRGIKLIAPNPNAVISSIMKGFKTHFDKVAAKKGVFKRKPQLN